MNVEGAAHISNSSKRPPKARRKLHTAGLPRAAWLSAQLLRVLDHNGNSRFRSVIMVRDCSLQRNPGEKPDVPEGLKDAQCLFAWV